MTRLIIRAVPSRQDCIDYLTYHLPTAEWCIDQKRDAMDTFLRAMIMAGDDPAVHMEEDIWLDNNFLNELETEISSKPDSVIQFFSMRKKDLTQGSRWEPGSTYLMNQCFYLPAEMSKKIAEYYVSWNRKLEHPTGCDIMLSDYFKQNKINYFLRVPSLVQHKVMKSAINPKRSSKRQSLTFGGTNAKNI